MESKISTEYLFHFTSKMDYLINILNQYFMPFYCLEKLSYLNFKDKNGNYLEMACPLVCFCDIPDPLQDTHRKKFGGYGIGLKKKWGIENGLSPVVYTHEDAITSANLSYLIKFHNDLIYYNIPEKKINAVTNHLSYLLMNYKPYEGYAYKKEEKQFDNGITRFYDEREWRYIPINCDGLKLNLDRKDYESPNELTVQNEKIQACNKLIFSISDISFLFLKDNSEIEPFLIKLSKKYSKDEINQIRDLISIRL